jgi:RNA ligase (TIGR02306 family)
MRKLASIRTIKEIRPHTNADSLELAIVDGWQVVVKKDEFKVGDSVVYFEVDSVLPVQEQYEFLRKCCYVNREWVEGFRLKTIKLRGEISQGLVLPCTYDVPEGTDVTELLGVKKWEPPVPAQLSGLIKGNFPSFIPKTDQERIQNLPEIFSDKESEWEVTLKLDGSSMTVYWLDDGMHVCSRNLELKLEQEGNTFVETAKRVFPEYPMYFNHLAIQGELMGPGIQGNREQLDKHYFYVYDIYDINEHRYLPYDQREEFCRAHNLLHVPVIAIDKVTDLQDMLNKADIPSINNPIAEGVVWKRMDGEKSFKVINNKFLLKEA